MHLQKIRFDTLLTIPHVLQYKNSCTEWLNVVRKKYIFWWVTDTRSWRITLFLYNTLQPVNIINTKTLLNELGFIGHKRRLEITGPQFYDKQSALYGRYSPICGPLQSTICILWLFYVGINLKWKTIATTFFTQVAGTLYLLIDHLTSFLSN